MRRGKGRKGWGVRRGGEGSTMYRQREEEERRRNGVS